jgi:hypothetical protein
MNPIAPLVSRRATFLGAILFIVTQIAAVATWARGGAIFHRAPRVIDAAIACPSATHCVVDHRYLDKLFRSSALVSSARFVPSYGIDHSTRGYRVMRLRANSLIARLGVHEHDLLLAVDGVPLTRPNISVCPCFGRAGDVRVLVERDGLPVTLTYSIR